MECLIAIWDQLPTRRLLLAVLVTATAVALPSAASAAPVVTFDHACYQNNGPTTKATFRVGGLAPGAVLPVALDGQVIGQVTADARGNVRNSFPVPAHTTPEEIESSHVLALLPTDTDPIAGTFLATSVGADFSPARGDPRTMKVKFTASGMNLVAASSKVYLHYLAPGGHHRLTVSLGRAAGACGLLQSAQRRLFPFPPANGKWTLQLDTSKKYRHGGARTRYPWARIGVRVRAVAAVR